MTGALLAVDIRGRDGLSLRDEWKDGPRSYLGLQVAAHVHEQAPGEGLDPDIVGTRWQTGDDVLEEADPLGDGEGPLLGRVVQDGNDHLVIEHRRARDDVDVPIGHRVVGTRHDGPADHALTHVSKPSNDANHSVVSPYFRALSAVQSGGQLGSGERLERSTTTRARSVRRPGAPRAVSTSARAASDRS